MRTNTGHNPVEFGPRYDPVITPLQPLPEVYQCNIAEGEAFQDETCADRLLAGVGNCPSYLGSYKDLELLINNILVTSSSNASSNSNSDSRNKISPTMMMMISSSHDNKKGLLRALRGQQLWDRGRRGPDQRRHICNTYNVHSHDMCIYIYICICVYVCIYVYVYIHIHIHIHMCVYVSLSISLHIYIERER